MVKIKLAMLAEIPENSIHSSLETIRTHGDINSKIKIVISNDNTRQIIISQQESLLKKILSSFNIPIFFD